MGFFVISCTSMILLLASILALIAAPVVYRLARSTAPTLAALDGFVFVAIGGVALLHIIPSTVKEVGWIALGVAILGLIGPTWIERALDRAASKAHTATVMLALLGLVVHGFLDGVAIASGGEEADRAMKMLSLAVVLHRFPEGLTVWWLLRPAYGAPWALSALGFLAMATVVGFVLAGAIQLEDAHSSLALFQALMAGSLLHVVIHSPPLLSPKRENRAWYLSSAVGALVGVALLVSLSEMVVHEHGHGQQLRAVASSFWGLLLESAPALVLAYLAAGLLYTYLPHGSIRWMRRGRPIGQALRGVAFGLPLPICSCGVIPLYRGLIKRGAPVAGAMAFLIATPEIGIDAVLLSIPLLGKELTVARVVAAAVVAIMVGWLLGRSTTDPGQRTVGADDGPPPAARGSARLRAGLHLGLVEMVDNTAAWIVLGLVIAAAGSRLIDESWLAGISSSWDVPLLALVGMPIYVCASGATPLVAMLIAKGISPGAALAFLLTGPATNVSTFGVLKQLHGTRLAISFGLSVALIATGLGYALNGLLPTVQVYAVQDPLAEGPPPWRLGFAGALALVYLSSILRQGPRRFVAQVLPAGLIHEHEHDQDHKHEHDHGHEHGDYHHH
jgi:uncharacterized membrane protein YraQ (UPF0718 family)